MGEEELENTVAGLHGLGQFRQVVIEFDTFSGSDDVGDLYNSMVDRHLPVLPRKVGLGCGIWRGR